MIVKSFLLRRSNSLDVIASLCDSETIAVIRPEKTVEGLFRDAIHKTIVEKKSAKDEFAAIHSYYYDISDSPKFRETVDTTLSGVEAYLREGMYIQASADSIEDYVLAKCARLCAEAVHEKVGGPLVDGTELVLCQSGEHIDWSASREQMVSRLSGKGPIVVAGGYGRLMSGYVVRVGKGGAHLMSSLIASAIGASSLEFHVEGRITNDTEAMTYDEATHYCAVAHPAFSSSAIWPAKNAGVPIVVKDINDASFPGTVISAGSAHKTGVIADKELALITVYGTGLLGKVGMSSAIFSCMAKEGVNVRFIAQTSSEYSISFAVRSNDRERAQEALKSLFRENPLLPLDDVVVLNQAVGIVTVFGSKMRNLPGTSAAVFGKLGAAGINIIASAQGGEELSISLVLDEADVDRACDLLH